MKNRKNWEAGGFSKMATWLGWAPPLGDDGMWRNKELGDYHDSCMAWVVISYASRIKWIKINDELDFSVRQIKQRLMEISDSANDIVSKFEDDPRTEVVSRALRAANDALNEINTLQFESAD